MKYLVLLFIILELYNIISNNVFKIIVRSEGAIYCTNDNVCCDTNWYF